ncbi:MAG: sodium:solute symporter, partial [Verrucomicrobiota bacterium]
MGDLRKCGGGIGMKLGSAVAAMLLLGAEAMGEEWLKWEPLPPIPDEVGLAGPFTGVHEDTLIVAGGANFAPPVWESDKVWHNKIYALSLAEENLSWRVAGELERPLGYGTTASLPEGVLCIGGNDASAVFSEVFLLSRNGSEVAREDLPSLPRPLVYASAALLGNHVYVAGGQTGNGLETATSTFLKLDWSKREEDSFGWEELESWPGPPRAFASLVAQSNGRNETLYLAGGRHLAANGEVTFLNDLYEFDPLSSTAPWTRKADLPAPLAAGTVAALGQSHLVVLGGADGTLFARSDELRDEHPGFPRQSFAYHTITNTWVEAGTLPNNQVTTEAVTHGEEIFLLSGEVRPRVRTPESWRVTLQSRDVPFAA